MIKDPILLIDGDEALHVALAAVEVETHWGGDVWTLHVNEQEAIDVIIRKLNQLREMFDPSKMILGFSGPHNWRKAQIDPAYKGNRVKMRKPMRFGAIKEAILGGKYLPWGDLIITASRAVLEADDVLSILATKPSNLGRTVIASQDKDFLGTPGTLFRGETNERGLPALVEVSLRDADRWHLIQTLAGDIVDGYSGCPGIGKETAAELLEAEQRFASFEKTLSRGPRKGQTVIEWDRVPSGSPWETVLSCFNRAGLGEADALKQARLARLLRWGEFDTGNARVKLWTP